MIYGLTDYLTLIQDKKVTKKNFNSNYKDWIYYFKFISYSIG